MMTSIDTIGEKEKEIASTWFFSLRDRICSEFEKLEHDQTVGPFKNLLPRKFERKETLRKGKEGEDGGGDQYQLLLKHNILLKLIKNRLTLSLVDFE